MSKKDYDYEGKLNQNHQQNNSEDDAGSKAPKPRQQDDSNNPKHNDNGQSDGSDNNFDQSTNDNPDIQQQDNNDELNKGDEESSPHADNDSANAISPQQRDLNELHNDNTGNGIQQRNGDNVGNPSNDQAEDNDKDTTDSNNMSDDENDQSSDPTKSNTSDSSDSNSSNDSSSDDNDNDEEDSDNNNDDDSSDDESIQQNNSDDNNDDVKQDKDEHLTNDDSLKDKALNKLDPNLAKAAKMKDLANKSKEDAKQELIEITKSIAKKKVAAAVASYLMPILIPTIILLMVFLLIAFAIFGGAVSINENSETKPKCSNLDKKATSIKSSKDADENAKNIYKYLKKEVKGAKSKAVAAHLGNMYVESAHSFDPSTIQGGEKFKKDLAMDESAGGYAFGISQWDSGRRVNLLKYAKKKGKKWDDLEVQMDFMINHDGSDSETIKKLLKDDGSIKDVTKKIMNEWERAGDTSSISERQSAASKYYSKFSKLSGSDSNISDSTDSANDNSDAGANSGCTTDSVDKTDGELGKSVKANDGSGEVIKQWKSKDKIPKKYRKHIELPEFSNKKLLDSDKNIFPATGNLGECTELTWAYMSQLWKGDQPTDGNGNEIYKAYKQKGAKTTNNPTVGYGFSSNPPYAGASLKSVGHTGVVIGVMDDGKWLMSNYNLNGEGSNDKKRVETFALVDGNKKKGGITFFSGVGDPKIKSKSK